MSDQPTTAAPLPRPSRVSAPFWAAAREHRLVLQRSKRTGQFVYYPRIVSPFALNDELTWERVSGRGTVVGATTVRHADEAALQELVPYSLAVVELDEGPRRTTNIVGCPPDRVYVGMLVEVTFEDVTPEVTLVKFRPAREAHQSPGGPEAQP